MIKNYINQVIEHLLVQKAINKSSVAKVKESLESFFSFRLVEIWTTEDILSLAEREDIELTDDEADDVLMKLEDDYAADIGINWDVILSTINQIKEGE